jgi:hypothetical protein
VKDLKSNGETCMVLVRMYVKLSLRGD